MNQSARKNTDPHPSRLSRDLSIDEFIERLQELLMVAPYSREVRQLRKFALRHQDPEYARAFLAKATLFDQQQRAIRPSCFLSAFMYRAEKMLGRLLSYRMLMPLVLLALAGVGSLTTVNTPVDPGNGKLSPDHIMRMLDAYAMRIEESPTPRRDDSPNDRMREQILESLRSPVLQQHLDQRIQKHITDSGAKSDEGVYDLIKRGIESALQAVELNDQQRRKLIDALADADASDEHDEQPPKDASFDHAVTKSDFESVEDHDRDEVRK